MKAAIFRDRAKAEFEKTVVRLRKARALYHETAKVQNHERQAGFSNESRGREPFLFRGFRGLKVLTKWAETYSSRSA